MRKISQKEHSRVSNIKEFTMANNNWSVAAKVRKNVTFGKSKINFKDIFVVIGSGIIDFVLYKFFPDNQFGLAMLAILIVSIMTIYLLMRPKNNPERRNYELFMIWQLNSSRRRRKQNYKKFSMKDLEN